MWEQIFLYGNVSENGFIYLLMGTGRIRLVFFKMFRYQKEFHWKRPRRFGMNV